MEKARTILESSDVDVNSLNSDGLAPLDVAVLSNNRPMTKMLLQHGAYEGGKGMKIINLLYEIFHELFVDCFIKMYTVFCSERTR